MGRKSLTHEQFMEQFIEKNPNASNIEVLGQYINRKTKIKCKCKIDGYEWEVFPNNLLKKYGCPKCSGVKKLTHEEFIKKFFKQNTRANNIEIIGEFKTTKTPIKCKCKIDGHIWEATPNHLLRNSGCPKCNGNAKLTYEEFINRISDDIEVVSEFKNVNTKIKCKCKIDGHIWEVLPNNLLHGNGCPKCNSSKGEKRINKYLKDNEIDFIEQYTFEDCKYKNVLPFDFYIPSLNILIEYDGKQHFESVEYFGGEEYFQIIQLRDNIKTEYCKKNDIKLIRIPYYDFDRIEEILEKELTLYKECNII